MIFGNSGSGKSQLINSLKNSVQIPERNFTTKKARHNLDAYPLRLIDTPGHTESVKFRKNEVEKIIKNGVEGIINVVSYGYDETPNADRTIAFDASGKINLEFLNQNRADEIARLDEWLEWASPENVKWIINVVNKADVWWEDYKVVDQYYKNGNYGKQFKHLSKFVPVVNIPHCSIIRPFFKVQTSGKFGDEEKDKLHTFFLSTLLNLLSEQK